MAKPAVTRNGFADHLRISTAVKTYKWLHLYVNVVNYCSKLREVFDLPKSQTRKLHKCGRCGRGLILYSDLTNPQVINSELKSCPHSACGKSFGRCSVFYKTRENTYWQESVHSEHNQSLQWRKSYVCGQDFSNGRIIPFIRKIHYSFRCHSGLKISGDAYSRDLPNVISVARLFVYTLSFLRLFTLDKNCINVIINVSGILGNNLKSGFRKELIL